jgi:hypothetical protein
MFALSAMCSNNKSTDEVLNDAVRITVIVIIIVS